MEQKVKEAICTLSALCFRCPDGIKRFRNKDDYQSIRKIANKKMSAWKAINNIRTICNMVLTAHQDELSN